ncbi:Choline/ethanolaminephosphotransferase 1, partial [Cucurbita argyrosperma subsp. sororia]
MCLATLPEPFRESLSSLDAVGSDDSHLVCYGSRSDLMTCSLLSIQLFSGCDTLACAFESLAFGVTVACGMNTFFLWVIAAIPSYGATWEQQVVSSQSEYWCSRLSSTTWKILTIFELGSIASSVLSVVYEVVQVRKGSMLLAFAMLVALFSLSHEVRI